MNISKQCYRNAFQARKTKEEEREKEIMDLPLEGKRVGKAKTEKGEDVIEAVITTIFRWLGTLILFNHWMILLYLYRSAMYQVL